MSEAQKLLIKRAAMTCEKHLVLADLAHKCGRDEDAHHHLRGAALCADFAFVVAAQA